MMRNKYVIYEQEKPTIKNIYNYTIIDIIIYIYNQYNATYTSIHYTAPPPPEINIK